MEIKETKPVLVVGAGPTGLLMACELARYKIPFRIIDKNAVHAITSNAAGIQTRSLEMFSDIGIIDRFLEKGVKCEGMHFHFKNKEIFSLSIDVIDSIYKFILMLPQSETEVILESYLNELGFHVERNKSLNSLLDNGEYVEVVVDDEKIQCSWVIGCDGAHSTVREQIGVAFPGEDIQDRFVVADIHITGLDSASVVSVFANVGSIMAIFPLGKDRYRIAANLHNDNFPKQLTENDVKTLIAQRIGSNVNVISTSWVSPFWIHSKLVTNMRKGHVFLAGDAAHIHSPVGGQGMNTGLQDVYNLAWKLAYVIQGKAHTSILDSYEMERQPVIQEIVNISEQATKFMITENRVLIWLRNTMFKFVNTQAWIKYKIAMRLTQLSIRYSNSTMIDCTEAAPNGAPKVGERAPDVILDNGKHLHEYFDNTKYNVLVFSVTNKELLNNIKQQNENIGNVLIIDDIDGASHRIHDCYKISGPVVYVVRPDNYIFSCRRVKN